MQKTLQALVKAFHLPHLEDSSIIEVGKMLYNEVDNEWIDTYNLFVEGYNEELSKEEQIREQSQW